MLHVLTKEKTNRCSYYFALEEYLLKRGGSEEFFFIWHIEPSLVVGRNQAIFDELDVDKAKEDGVNIYRRPSGGGAVYADENCLMFSFITPHFDTKMVFHTYLNKMVEAFQRMKIPCSFSGRNDLLVEGKKFSGNAFYRIHNHACLHGTLLFATDISKMGRYLTPNKKKLQSKGIQSVAMRVSNLAPYYPGTIDTFYQELIQHLQVTDYPLSPEEEIIVRHFQQKYEKDEWIFRKTTYSKKIQTFTPAGVIDLNFTIHEHIIQNFSITGDFFEHADLKEIEQTLVGVPFEKNKVIALLKQLKLEQYIYDLDVDMWLLQVKQGLDEAKNVETIAL